MSGPSYSLPVTRVALQHAESTRFGKHNTVEVGGYIRSEDWDGDEAGDGSTVGWYVGGDGLAVFNEVTVRGSFKTAETGERIEMLTTAANEIRFYSGEAGETNPGRIFVDATAGTTELSMNGPMLTGVGTPFVTLTGETATGDSNILIGTDTFLAAQLSLSTDTGARLTTSGLDVTISSTGAGGDVLIESAADIELTPTGNVVLDGETVSFGAADSAGAGFRLVRVPN